MRVWILAVLFGAAGAQGATCGQRLIADSDGVGTQQLYDFFRAKLGAVVELETRTGAQGAGRVIELNGNGEGFYIRLQGDAGIRGLFAREISWVRYSHEISPVETLLHNLPERHRVFYERLRQYEVEQAMVSVRMVQGFELPGWLTGRIVSVQRSISSNSLVFLLADSRFQGPLSLPIASISELDRAPEFTRTKSSPKEPGK